MHLAGNPGTANKVDFIITDAGERVLSIDQYHYKKYDEDNFLEFWQCQEFKESKCPAAVATMKSDKSRVVVLNDMHKHIVSRKVLLNTTTTPTPTIKSMKMPLKATTKTTPIKVPAKLAVKVPVKSPLKMPLKKR